MNTSEKAVTSTKLKYMQSVKDLSLFRVVRYTVGLLIIDRKGHDTITTNTES